jgi:hypothetical protein
VNQDDAIIAAAILTAGAASGQAAQIPVDPTIASTQLRNLHLQMWEQFRIFYTAIVGTASDPKDWPAPPESGPNLPQHGGGGRPGQTPAPPPPSTTSPPATTAPATGGVAASNAIKQALS